MSRMRKIIIKKWLLNKEFLRKKSYLEKFDCGYDDRYTSYTKIFLKLHNIIKEDAPIALQDFELWCQKNEIIDEAKQFGLYLIKYLKLDKGQNLISEKGTAHIISDLLKIFIVSIGAFAVFYAIFYK